VIIRSRCSVNGVLSDNDIGLFDAIRTTSDLLHCTKLHVLLEPSSRSRSTCPLWSLIVRDAIIYTPRRREWSYRAIRATVFTGKMFIK